MVEAEREVLVLLHGALGRVQLAAHQLEERGLAAAVRAHLARDRDRVRVRGRGRGRGRGRLRARLGLGLELGSG